MELKAKQEIAKRFNAQQHELQIAAYKAMKVVCDSEKDEIEIGMKTYLNSVLGVYFIAANLEDSERIRLEMVRILLDDVQQVATFLAGKAAVQEMKYEAVPKPKDA